MLGVRGLIRARTGSIPKLTNTRLRNSAITKRNATPKSPDCCWGVGTQGCRQACFVAFSMLRTRMNVAT